MPTQMLAAPDDLADYRAYRLAKQEGTRLARAQSYLKRHPHGAWADEVRIAFDDEETAWFEAAKNSRAIAKEYLVDLPQGPHAEAARALLGLFNEHESDPAMLELLAESRRTAAMLDLESERRKRVGEVVLEELSALLDPATWDPTLEDPPPALAAVLRGPAAHTWGSPPPGAREDELFFVLPTPTEREDRVAQVRFRLVIQRGRAVRGLIEGEDLFLRWAEANETRVLDPTLPADRLAAANEVSDVLRGALEARLPLPRCAAQLGQGEILARDCDGWHVSIRMGARAGEDDAIVVQGPRQ
jgi:hypothetical protein